MRHFSFIIISAPLVQLQLQQLHQLHQRLIRPKVWLEHRVYSWGTFIIYGTLQRAYFV